MDNTISFVNNETKSVLYRTKNSNNQTIELLFDRWEENYKIIWWVCLQVTNKKNKPFPYLQITGKGGLENLLWAKNIIKEFIKKDLFLYKDNIILVKWGDTKRKKTYIKGLKDLGFRICRYEGEDILYLKTNK